MTRRNAGWWVSRDSVRARLTITIVAAAILPLVAVVAILGRWTYSSIEGQSLELQEQAAAAVESEIRSIIAGIEAQLVMLDEVLALESRTAAEQEAALRNLLAHSRLYQELSLVDVDDGERLRVSRARASPDLNPAAHEQNPAVARATATGSSYFGPVYFDGGAREPLSTVAVPMFDRRTGEISSVVVATIRFKPIWELLAGIVESNRGDVYVVAEDGLVIAHSNPAVVLTGMRLDVPAANGHAMGLNGSESVIATEPLRVGDKHLIVVAEQEASVALTVANRLLIVTIGVTILALLFAGTWAAASVRHVVKPIEALAASAERITSGDLAHRASVTSRGEIGDLARAFNEMTLQLSDVIASLEERVQARTADLEESVEVQRQLAEQLGARNAELEAMGRSLRELISSKDVFLGSVSHELRTPLTAVLGYALVLRDDYSEFVDEERRHMIAAIAGQAQEMSDLIDDLLVAARGDPTGLVVDIEPVDLSSEIDAVLNLWPDRSVQVELPDAGSATAFADATRVRQIMRNLVGNSIRYGGPNIAIHVDDTGPDVAVHVVDDGTGIDRAEWETVFEPYRTAQGKRQAQASVGLGLTISRTLARRMGGDLTYRYENSKSVFELTLPRHAPEPQQTVAVPRTADFRQGRGA